MVCGLPVQCKAIAYVKEKPELLFPNHLCVCLCMHVRVNMHVCMCGACVCVDIVSSVEMYYTNIAI